MLCKDKKKGHQSKLLSWPLLQAECLCAPPSAQEAGTSNPQCGAFGGGALGKLLRVGPHERSCGLIT